MYIFDGRVHAVAKSCKLGPQILSICICICYVIVYVYVYIYVYMIDFHSCYSCTSAVTEQTTHHRLFSQSELGASLESFSALIDMLHIRSNERTMNHGWPIVLAIVASCKH